jgi:glycosyltransferase involved in cell wall biosynthesis
MTELLQHPERFAAMGREARRLAATTFDTRIIIAQTLAVYERVLGGSPHRDSVRPRHA